MAFLNISQLCGFMVDMWTKVISWFNGAIGNYAWSIILLTLAIKVLLLPLDFFNKKTSRKNSQMQAKIQPQLAKLQQKYGNDKNTYNQKVAEVYKANNYNVVGSCLFMLVYMVVTLVIFITLFSGLNTMASKKIIGEYDALKQTYNTAYTTQIEGGATEDVASEYANGQVRIKYNEIKKEFSWLWIDNVWKSDMPTNSIPSADEYLKIAKTVTVGEEDIAVKNLTADQKEEFKVEYAKVMTPLEKTEGRTNGFLILTVLTIASAFLTQWLSWRKNKKTSDNNPMASSGKIMMILMPLMLGFFALTYNAVFALYLLTSQIIALASTPIIDLILDKMEKVAEQKQSQTVVMEYSRTNIQKNKDHKQKKSKKENEKEYFKEK